MTIEQAAVTLTHDEANTVAQLLHQLAHSDYEHANRTKSPAIRAYVRQRAEQASQLESAIVRRMFEAR